MNWKTITNLEGLPISDHELVLVHSKSGEQQTVQAFRVRTRQCADDVTHWAWPEPPKPQTESEAFMEWFQKQPSTWNIQACLEAFRMGVAWERAKK